jgi:NADH:ubiquinone oxidoreductase subunit K
VLVPGCHGGMFDHNTMRVLTSFHIVFLTFNLCFRQITSDSSKGATVMIVFAIALYYQKDIILASCFVDLAPGHR